MERHCPMLLLALGRRLLAGRNHAELGAQQDHLFLQFPCSHPLHRAAEFVDGVRFCSPKLTTPSCSRLGAGRAVASKYKQLSRDIGVDSGQLLGCLAQTAAMPGHDEHQHFPIKRRPTSLRRHGSLPHRRAARTPRRRLARGAACLDMLCGADQLALPRASPIAFHAPLNMFVRLKGTWVGRRLSKQVHRDILRRARG